MIKKYETMYSVNLYVCLFSDWDTCLNRFNFFVDINDFDSNVTDPPTYANINKKNSGCTYLVREKKSYTGRGILVLLNEDYLYKEDYEFLLDLVSHESSHATDAIWQHIGGKYHNFDDGDEPRAYLLGWIAGKIGSYLSEYFKTIKDE